MKNKRGAKSLLVLILIGVLSFQLLSPQPVYARTWLQNIGRGFKKSVAFVARVPDKATRWMGPVLGPIASSVLTHNLSSHSKFANIFNKARRANNIIQNIEQQKELLKELKAAYADQATDFRKKATELREQRKSLATDLVAGNLDFDDYMKKAVSFEKMAQTYDKAADDFQHRSETMTEKTIINIVLKNATNTIISKIKKATIYEVQQEIKKLVRSDVITKILGESGGNDRIIDVLVADEIGEFLGRSGNEDISEQDFKDRLRDKIKDLVKESKNDLQKNWNEKISEVMQELADEMKAETSEAKSDAEKSGEEKDEEKQPEKNVRIPVDENGCKPGYEWNKKVGDCIQTNCNDVPDAHHSYTLDCVCGSSGAMEENPKDPNKECSYPSDYSSCPGCVYACVHLDEDCPEL